VAGGNDPGLIYSSDLFAHIQGRVQEGIETLGLARIAETPVFAGAYTKDPLLFVHLGLTLQQIRVRTSRYSPASFRRVVFRLLGSLSAAAAFVLGARYSLREGHEYVVAEPEGLVVLSGYPGYNAFGFPADSGN
jgi:hypothetical protein